MPTQVQLSAPDWLRPFGQGVEDLSGPERRDVRRRIHTDTPVVNEMPRSPGALMAIAGMMPALLGGAKYLPQAGAVVRRIPETIRGLLRSGTSTSTAPRSLAQTLDPNKQELLSRRAAWLKLPQHIADLAQTRDTMHGVRDPEMVRYYQKIARDHGLSGPNVAHELNELGYPILEDLGLAQINAEYDFLQETMGDETLAEWARRHVSEGGRLEDISGGDHRYHQSLEYPGAYNKAIDLEQTIDEMSASPRWTSVRGWVEGPWNDPDQRYLPTVDTRSGIRRDVEEVAKYYNREVLKNIAQSTGKPLAEVEAAERAKKEEPGPVARGVENVRRRLSRKRKP